MTQLGGHAHFLDPLQAGVFKVEGHRPAAEDLPYTEVRVDQGWWARHIQPVAQLEISDLGEAGGEDHPVDLIGRIWCDRLWASNLELCPCASNGGYGAYSNGILGQVFQGSSQGEVMSRKGIDL